MEEGPEVRETRQAQDHTGQEAASLGAKTDPSYLHAAPAPAPPSWGLVLPHSTGSGLGQGIVPGARQAAAHPQPTPAQHKPAILGKTKAGRGRAALVSPWWVSGPCRTSAVGTGSGARPPPGAANQISPGQPQRGRQEEAQLQALGLLPSSRARTLLPSVGRPELPVGVRTALSPPWTLCPTCKTNVLSGTFQASPGQLPGECRAAAQPGAIAGAHLPGGPAPGPAQCPVRSPARPPYPESRVLLSGGRAREQGGLSFLWTSLCPHVSIRLSVHLSICPSILLGALFSQAALTTPGPRVQVEEPGGRHALAPYTSPAQGWREGWGERGRAGTSYLPDAGSSKTLRPTERRE